MKITAVLPIWNEEERAEETIESLLNQKDQCKIIIINDGSTDKTSEILDKYKKHELIDIHTNVYRKGAAYCRNYGNSLVETPYIAAADSDYYYPNRNTILLENLSADVLYTSWHWHNKKFDKILVQQALPVGTDFFDGKLNKVPVRHPTACYRTKLAQKHPYPEVSLETDCFEKFFLTLMKCKYSFKVINVPTVLIYGGTCKRNKKIGTEFRLKHYAEFGIKFSK